MEVFKKKTKKSGIAGRARHDGGSRAGGDVHYAYHDAAGREETVAALYGAARTAKLDVEALWRKYEDYHSGDHVTTREIAGFLRDKGIPWIPAVVTDPWIHVESQITPDIPDFEMLGRDGALDPARAKQREYVIKYVLESNRVSHVNTRNERRLIKLGNAFFKVYYEHAAYSPATGARGEIVVADADPYDIFPDPAAKTVDDCEYIDYRCRMHKRQAARVFAEDLARLDVNIDEIVGRGILDAPSHDSVLGENDTVTVLEHWYRDGEGDIALCILLGDREIRHIPKYWQKTGEQNKQYPFVKYCRIPNENSFWDHSELFPILELVDAADRELAYGLINDAFLANDIIIKEENALADGAVLDNTPGAVWEVRQGHIGGIRRLGGLQSLAGRLAIIDNLQQQIERTVGNYNSSLGREPMRVTTASGIAQLNERADARKNLKRADRLAGFESLYELIDWTALEFYDDDRLIYIGAPEAAGPAGPVMFRYNARSHMLLNDKGDLYFPRLDAMVRTGETMRKSPSFTLSALEGLLSIPVTRENYRIVAAFVDMLDIPQRKEILEDLKGRFEGEKIPPPPEGGTPLWQGGQDESPSPPLLKGGQPRGGKGGLNHAPSPAVAAAIGRLPPDLREICRRNPEIARIAAELNG